MEAYRSILGSLGIDLPCVKNNASIQIAGDLIFQNVAHQGYSLGKGELS
jgi:hypothetical protein